MTSATRLAAFLLLAAIVGQPVVAAEGLADASVRRPTGEVDLRIWLENMVVFHRFTDAEIELATGLSQAEVRTARENLNLWPNGPPPREADDPLFVVPYPGGRHPRIGFLDGAIRPRRESKVSVFAPWKDGGYVVADIPEAIWSNNGLIWLAHEHVPTVWSRQDIQLDPLEWKETADVGLEVERTLPDGVRFGTRVKATLDSVEMEMWLTNASDQPLSDLRVQNCVMLKGLKGFEEQSNENKVFSAPYAAARDAGGRRWVIVAWEPNDRSWGNAPCPCIHSDPKFPDCPPGETRRLRGRLSFYEGEDIEGEFRRIDATGWRTASP